MPAGVQEDMHPAPGVAAENDRLVAHPGHKEIAGVGDLAFMADEQPGTREQLLQFLPVEVGGNEDLRLIVPRSVSII